MSRNTRNAARNSGPEILDDNDDTVVTDPSSLENSERAKNGDDVAADADETAADDAADDGDRTDSDDEHGEADGDDLTDEADRAEGDDLADAAEGTGDDDRADAADGTDVDDGDRIDGDDVRDEVGGTEGDAGEGTDVEDGADDVTGADESDEVDGSDVTDEADRSSGDDERAEPLAASSHDDASTISADGPAQQELPNIEPPLDPVDLEVMASAAEAIIFAAGDPVSNADIKAVLERAYSGDSARVRKHKLEHFKDAMKLLRERWAQHGEARGFGLFEVAEGLTFRSNPRYADYLRETREQKPVRLSKPALETLAIIAYRQPVTKPEVDHIRGVDCGGTIRILLDRDLVRIVGKREEPGRPMLYGTTREFLSFFNLPSLNQLPSLREFSELTEESQEEIQQTLGPSLEDLSHKAKKLRLDEEPAVAALDEAVVELDSTENKTRDAFASQGIAIDPAAESPPEQTPQDSDGKAGES